MGRTKQGQVNTQIEDKNHVQNSDDSLEFDTKEGKLTINSLNTHFLVLAATRSGKTKSIGLPILRQYLIKNYVGFIYDAKKLDYTRHAYLYKYLLKLQTPIYHLVFDNVNESYRTNIIKPSIIRNTEFLGQIISDIAKGVGSDEVKQDEWFKAGLGVVQGVAARLYEDFPQYCTLGHVSLLVIKKDVDQLEEFLNANNSSQDYAAEFLKSSKSEKTQASISWTAAQILKPIAVNRNVCYILGGDDFDFNLLEDGHHKIITASNDDENENVLNGLLGSMVNILSRHIKFGNKKGVFFFMDEGTTYYIPNFSRLLGKLAEYRVSFTLLTQGKSMIEEVYKSVKTDSIVSNFNNKFLGRTNNPKDARDYSSIFGSQEIKRVSQSKGSTTNSKSNSRSEGENVGLVDKAVFKPDHFQQQERGQFTCSFLDGNYRSGTFHFEQENIDLEKLKEVVTEVSNHDEDVTQQYYREVLRDIEKM